METPALIPRPERTLTIRIDDDFDLEPVADGGELRRQEQRRIERLTTVRRIADIEGNRIDVEEERVDIDEFVGQQFRAARGPIDEREDDCRRAVEQHGAANEQAVELAQRDAADLDLQDAAITKVDIAEDA